jgi:UDP-N-acetylmuramate: L-alanyl-gamma-D-glutamyl-meso-diaminopimelate ligase
MFERPRSVHFIGIGGVGMAATAAMAAESGFTVTGSDSGVFPPTSDFLRERKLDVRESYSVDNLEPAPDLVVVGNALSRGNPEVEAMLDRRLNYCSMPDFVREAFLQGKRVTLVAGTHGKTSITTLLAWLLEKAGRSPSFLAGGISLNFNSNYRLGEGEDFIVEGDEYDTAFFDKRSKFLLYRPEIVVLANIEFDHADIFPSQVEYHQAFRRLVNLIPSRGALVAGAGDLLVREAAAACRCPAVMVRPADPADFTFPIPGEHYLQNARMAAAAARVLGLNGEEIAAGMESYRGVKRRLEVIYDRDSVLLYDDFAHHPTSIRLDLEALRGQHRDRRIWAIFEPRSNTVRRKIFQSALPQAFAAADEVIIGAIHRAEKLSLAERLDPDRVARDITESGRRGRYIPAVEDILRTVREEVRPGDIVVVMSNGVFGGLLPRLREELENRGPLDGGQL